MSYTDLRDFEAEAVFEIPAVNFDDPTLLRIEIEKLGGGTVGEEYAGTWRYRVIVKEFGTAEDETILVKGQDLHTGYPTTHRGAARQVADFLAHHGGEELCEIAGSVHERLCLWGNYND